MTRYYTSALTSADRLALARGDKNHNLRPWTPKDALIYEEARKDLMPTNTYVRLPKKVCIAPVTVVAKGHTSGLISSRHSVSPQLCALAAHH